MISYISCFTSCTSAALSALNGTWAANQDGRPRTAPRPVIRQSSRASLNNEWHVRPLACAQVARNVIAGASRTRSRMLGARGWSAAEEEKHRTHLSKTRDGHAATSSPPWRCGGGGGGGGRRDWGRGPDGHGGNGAELRLLRLLRCACLCFCLCSRSSFAFLLDALEDLLWCMNETSRRTRASVLTCSMRSVRSQSMVRAVCWAVVRCEMQGRVRCQRLGLSTPVSCLSV